MVYKTPSRPSLVSQLLSKHTDGGGFFFGTVIVTLVLSDADFASLVAGKANAQRLFMGGKLKIKGNIMKATKLDPVLKKAQTKAKL